MTEIIVVLQTQPNIYEEIRPHDEPPWYKLLSDNPINSNELEQIASNHSVSVYGQATSTEAMVDSVQFSVQSETGIISEVLTLDYPILWARIGYHLDSIRTFVEIMLEQGISPIPQSALIVLEDIFQYPPREDRTS